MLSEESISRHLSTCAGLGQVGNSLSRLSLCLKPLEDKASRLDPMQSPTFFSKVIFWLPPPRLKSLIRWSYKREDLFRSILKLLYEENTSEPFSLSKLENISEMQFLRWLANNIFCFLLGIFLFVSFPFHNFRLFFNPLLNKSSFCVIKVFWWNLASGQFSSKYFTLAQNCYMTVNFAFLQHSKKTC